MAGNGFDQFGAQQTTQKGDVTPLINAIAPNPAKNDAAQAASKPPEQPQSYLEKGADLITSKFIKNDDLRHTVDKYASQFVQTASLFTGGKVGLAATFLTYGLGAASPDTQLKEQAENFALGGARGTLMKGLFAVTGEHIAFAPTKGIVMGVGSRAIDTIVSPTTFTNPGQTLENLKTQTMNPSMWMYDAAVWTAGEALMGGTNALTGNMLNRSRIASGIFAGGTFGAVSGGAGEIMQERANGEKIDWGKVAQKGLLEGGINAAAAGVGGGITMAMERSSVKVTEAKTPPVKGATDAKPLSMLRIAASDSIAPLSDGSGNPPPQREFVITGGKENLDAFQKSQAQSATVEVREVTTDATGKQVLGDQKSLFVQQLGAKESALLPGAAGADLVASCHPENLSIGEQNNHVFPDSKGHVWLITGQGDQMLLSSSEQAMVRVARMGDFNNATRLDGGDTTINVMAPLMIGDPQNPNSDFSKAQWGEFDRQLGEAKKLGVNAVSTDVWWGLIEPQKGQFDWSYYDKISQHITKAGLDWVPILSFHQCGGNVGDTYTVKVPDWVWTDMAAKTGKSPDYFKFKSEQGHTSSEDISFFTDKQAQDYYSGVMNNFRDHFASIAPNVQEINVSLGPAGELRYPSYNSHDNNAGYPTRGALQMYGDSAVDSLRDFMIKRYGSVDEIGKKWNIPNLTLDTIKPPDNAQQFFDQNNQYNTQYGRDLFDWYNQTLIDHGRNTLGTALRVFGADGSPFGDTDIGAKVAGVHWRVGTNNNGQIVPGDRLAELSAGLIRTSNGDQNSDATGHGYRPILSMLHDLQPTRTDGHGNRVIPFFTCIEISDGDNGPQVKSLAHTLASWFGIEAKNQGLWLKGENALNGNLHNQNGWDNIDSLMTGGNAYYHGATFLRMEDIVNDPYARARASELIKDIGSDQPKAPATPVAPVLPKPVPPPQPK